MIENYWTILISICISIFFIEILCFVIVNYVNKDFQWLITSKDRFPELSKKGLEKFLEHGYDNELGWVRKPNTEHFEKGKLGQTKWTINSKGCRTNPNFDKNQSEISCYGDSFTFCRQVDDNETWEHILSHYRGTNVTNFGVGNYGLDQVLLRLKREFEKYPTKIVIVGIVPDTISRILSVWKHYYEYGNTFGFKPRYEIHNKKLKLIKNYIDEEEKFSHYQTYIKKIQEHDYFYKEKFEKEILHFPYSLTIYKNPKRNLSIIYWILRNKILKTQNEKNLWMPMETIMKINLKWRIKLFQNLKSTKLFKNIIEEMIEFSQEKNFRLVLIILPQKDDLLFIKKDFHFYKKFIEEIKDLAGLNFIDITNELIKENNLDEFYSDNNDYGGHYSKKGNEKIATIINQKL
jgi:hypothetical protein